MRNWDSVEKGEYVIKYNKFITRHPGCVSLLSGQHRRPAPCSDRWVRGPPLPSSCLHRAARTAELLPVVAGVF